MKKSITYSLFTMLICLALFVGKTGAQTTIYYQDFDSTSNLPTGWTTTVNNGGTLWSIDASANDSSYAWNGTSGYNGASGLNNIEIPNPTTGTIGNYAFTSVLYTCNIPTTNWKTISVGWGARNTKHFQDDASEVQGLYMSTDGGANWDSIPYFENLSNSEWFWDNNPSGANIGDAPNISLPSTADHQANLMFKLVVDLYYTASGTYRIDDFTVSGTSSPNGVVDIQDKPQALVYVIGNSTINIVAKDMAGPLTVQLFNTIGQNLREEIMTGETYGMNVSNLASGIYLVTISNSASSQVSKVSINR